MMKKAFASIVDVNFTAMMEGLLDMVEEGKVHWKSVIENFYPDFEIAVKNAEKELEKIKIEDEVTDVICDEWKKYGREVRTIWEISCMPGFPECRNTKPHFEKVGIPCPMCGGEVVLKKTKKEENITDVKIIRNVNLCHGRNHPQSNVKNAEAI